MHNIRGKGTNFTDDGSGKKGNAKLALAKHSANSMRYVSFSTELLSWTARQAFFDIFVGW